MKHLKRILPTLGLVCIAVLQLASCARVPVQAVTLSAVLKDEGERMHNLNVLLVDYVFNEKKHLINEFIHNNNLLWSYKDSEVLHKD
ncbi:MAG: hypothetical protein EOO03_03855 [Chitinophagaceae bacterium]|nr:MAG: hypothetical protein EOO03_03855 [Chitinophagaceae bacterium]